MDKDNLDNASVSEIQRRREDGGEEYIKAGERIRNMLEALEALPPVRLYARNFCNGGIISGEISGNDRLFARRTDLHDPNFIDVLEKYDMDRELADVFLNHPDVKLYQDILKLTAKFTGVKHDS